MSYPNRLPPNSFNGYVNEVRIRWTPFSSANLPEVAGSTEGVARDNLKALCENFLYDLAHRLQKTDARLMHVNPLSLSLSRANSFTGGCRMNSPRIVLLV